MHMLARERLPSVPKLAFGCFGGVAVGGLELAQDVVTAPALGCDDFNFLSWNPLASSQKVPVTETNTWT